ncbi:MAG: 16S rRNA (uracil(1498)-N(3))-methyltransferase [Nitrospirae bacterium]|nr:MAG: 16S rRNA (uracil(1498)-N(3))-methyltransferase [Nitrospirota bacterium]
MPRIFLATPFIQDDVISISSEKAAYISVVMRCVPGDLLDIQDGTGRSYRARILSADKREVRAVIIDETACHTESFLNIRLFQGLLKGDKMDLVIQKTVELGVREIVPVITERSQVRETRKLQRWMKIAEEASRQSGRSEIPVIHDAIPLDKMYSDEKNVQRKGVVFWEQGGDYLPSLFDTFRGVRDIDILTGPEGGLSDREVGQTVDNGFRVATLGRRILRAETAAIAAVSLTQYALGDLGGVPA